MNIKKHWNSTKVQQVVLLFTGINWTFLYVWDVFWKGGEYICYHQYWYLKYWTGKRLDAHCSSMDYTLVWGSFLKQIYMAVMSVKISKCQNGSIGARSWAMESMCALHSEFYRRSKLLSFLSNVSFKCFLSNVFFKCFLQMANLPPLNPQISWDFFAHLILVADPTLVKQC